MSSVKSGFILTDALAAAAIVCMMSCSICWCVLSHANTVTLIEKQINETEEETELFLKGIQACSIPCEEEETDSF